jgi:hypothetical protein
MRDDLKILVGGCGLRDVVLVLWERFKEIEIERSM